MNFCAQHKVSRPPLSGQHMQQRRQWCQEHPVVVTWQLKNGANLLNNICWALKCCPINYYWK